MIIDTAQFAAVQEAADQLAAEAGPDPADPGAAWRRGFAVGIKAAMLIAQPEPARHARPRGHLRLVQGGRR